ncbi:MAG: MFS transporter, partial [Candidatus Latescibacterota bacterium]
MALGPERFSARRRARLPQGKRATEICQGSLVPRPSPRERRPTAQRSRGPPRAHCRGQSAGDKSLGAAGLSRRLVPIPIPRALARLNWDVRLFMVSAVATGVCYTGLYFLLINLYLLRMGYGVEFIGVFISTGAFSFALFSLPAGAAGRRWGSRRPMIFGVCVLSFGLAMLALSALLPAAWQPIWLLSFCALREWGNAFYLVNANPYLMSVTQSEERAHVFSTRGTLTPLAGFAGALLGGLLPALSAALFALDERDPLCYVAPLLLASLLLLPGLGCLVLAGEGREEDAQSASQARGARPLNAMLAVG